MRLRLSSDSSFLLSTYVFAMAAAANLYFYFWYQQLKLIYVAFLRQDHRAKCETISLFPLTTNNSIAEKGFLSSVKHIPYPSALLFWHSLDVCTWFFFLVWNIWFESLKFTLNLNFSGYSRQKYQVQTKVGSAEEPRLAPISWQKLANILMELNAANFVVSQIGL